MVADNHLRTIKPLWEINGILQGCWRNLKKMFLPPVTQTLSKENLLADSTITFSFNSHWQEVFIPSFLNVPYSQESNRRCYFWHCEKAGEISCWPRNIPGVFPKHGSPSAGQGPLFPCSVSAMMWSVFTTKASRASAIVAFIFYGWSAFTLLNSVTANFFVVIFANVQKKALVQIWAIKQFLLGLVCLWPIKANSTGQAAQAVCTLRVVSKWALAGDCFPLKK